MGTYLGLFNGTICAPQIIAAALGGVVLSAIGNAENGAPDQACMLLLAGVLLIIGAFVVGIIKEKK